MYIRCQSLKIIFSVSKDFQLFGEAKEGLIMVFYESWPTVIHTYKNTYIHTFIALFEQVFSVAILKN